MRRAAVIVVFVGLAVAGLAAGTFASGREASANSLGAASLSKVTRVTVIATDSRFKLSTRRAPMGTVIFTVTNKGTVSHDFKIAGKKTSPSLARALRNATGHLLEEGPLPVPLHCSRAGGRLEGRLRGRRRARTPAATTSDRDGRDRQDDRRRSECSSSPRPDSFSRRLTMPSGMVTFVITSYCPNSAAASICVGVKAGAILLGGSETWTVPAASGQVQLPLRRRPLPYVWVAHRYALNGQ